MNRDCNAICQLCYEQINCHLKSAYFRAVLSLMGIVILSLISPISWASTGDDELTGAKDRLLVLLQGSFPVIVSLISATFGIIGSVLKFNAYAILTPFGVSIAAALGPGIIVKAVGAML